MKSNLLTFVAFLISINSVCANSNEKYNQYAEIQSRLQSSWGTFNHKSVLSHVLLPQGFAMNICIKTHGLNADNYLREALISSRGYRSETISPGLKAYDGSYSELKLSWNGICCNVQSAYDKSTTDYVILISPISKPNQTASVILESGFLWNMPGSIELKDSILSVFSGQLQFNVHSLGVRSKEFIASNTAYLSLEFNDTVAFYTGETKTLEQIKELVDLRKKELQNSFKIYADLDSTYEAMQNVIAWNVIFDPSNKRVIYPVSRLWNDNFGGQYVLFNWDTYLSAYMASMGSKDLAYANAIEITKVISKFGFVPNYISSYGAGSYDRSQPPVGSFVIKELYRKFRDKWLLEYVFDDLLKWNRWWEKERDTNGLLCWGSNAPDSTNFIDNAAHTWQGAAYESGLDNSPMFDNVGFNTKTNQMEQADIGLMGLYILDCQSLADIAEILNRDKEYDELCSRMRKYKKKLQKLWCNSDSIFFNLNTRSLKFNKVISPTNFYAMCGKSATENQAKQMVDSHLLNAREFNTHWMLPSIAANHPTYREQDYWRGRIWAPLNFLVYIGLLNYDLPYARKILVEKSKKLMMDNVRVNGWIFENYNAITGNISDQNEGRSRGDNYYHWGALLGFISFIENGYVENPTIKIRE